VVMTSVARGLKRTTFLLKTEVYCFTVKVTVTKLHLNLVRHFNLDRFNLSVDQFSQTKNINNTAAKDYFKVHWL
jgi:hypothetical protein